MGKSGFLGLEFKSESFHDESKPTSFSNMEPKFDFESKVNEQSFHLYISHQMQFTKSKRYWDWQPCSMVPVIKISSATSFILLKWFECEKLDYNTDKCMSEEIRGGAFNIRPGNKQLKRLHVYFTCKTSPFRESEPGLNPSLFFMTMTWAIMFYWTLIFVAKIWHNLGRP